MKSKYNIPVGRYRIEGVKTEIEPSIIANYFAKTPVALVQPLCNRNRVSWTGDVRRNGPQANVGALRLTYSEDGYLYSYSMPLCLRTKGPKGEDFILVNGDGSPSPQTTKHMGLMREFLVERGSPPKILQAHAYIPFSVLERASIRPEHVLILDTTPDREIKQRIRRKNRDTGEMEERLQRVHFLGETYFKNVRSGRHYVCGLDRNDDPNKRSFYLAEIPRSEVMPTTVDEALEALRPPGLPKKALRQGEWFFVPTSKKFTKKTATLLKRTAIVSADPKEQEEAATRDLRQRRHVPTRLALNGAVYAKGFVRDAEHDTLVLGDIWHRVVRNLAPNGWRYVPTGNTRGARVD
jgi:hypothetical protein